VVCDGGALPPDRRVFTPEPGYEPTLVLAAGPRERFGQLEGFAEVVYVGGDGAPSVDLGAGLGELKGRGVSSILCEGGPRLAARLLVDGLVDRLHWIVAPRLLAGPEAVPALSARASLERGAWTIDRIARLGDDVLFSARRSAA
jgi:diaminohydroxyphosphoribosylaminopyrimidine deaminase/5-amino-6-(5-phosphoribosylamino)uracil reductase